MVKTKILKIKDKSDSYYTKKNKIWDLPFRLLINGKSQLSGKSTFILNLFRTSFYGNDFKGENIYVCTNNKIDTKMKLLQEYKLIPDENFFSFDEDYLSALYEIWEEDFIEAVSHADTPPNLCLILDDTAYSNALKSKQTGIISKIIMNGRHINLSSVFTSQKFSLIGTNIRSNVTGAVLFNTSQRELELITDEFNYYENKKDFISMFRRETLKPHSFLVVNFTNQGQGLYYDSEFNEVSLSQ